MERSKSTEAEACARAGTHSLGALRVFQGAFSGWAGDRLQQVGRVVIPRAGESKGLRVGGRVERDRP